MFPSFKKQEKAAVTVPERWQRGRRRLALSCMAAIFAISYISQSAAGVDNMDRWWLKARFALRERITGPERDNRISIVAIDDASLDKWPEPLVLWGGHIADAVNQLARSGAKVIALDYIQPIEVDELLKVSNDQKVGEAFQSAKNVVLVKEFRSDGKGVLPAVSWRFALPNGFEDGGESHMGYADISSGENSLWTSIYPSIVDKDKTEVSFAARIVDKSGLADYRKVKTRPDGTMLVNFKSGAGNKVNGTFDYASIADVATAKKPDPRWKDKIVLIGATYKGLNDDHYVPILEGVTGSRLIPGVEGQAHAVATMLDDAAIHEPLGPAMLLLSAFMGAVGTLAFAVWNWGRATLGIIVAGLSWTLLSLALFYTENFALPIFLPLSMMLFGAGVMSGYRAFSEERERAQVMSVWGRYQDQRIIDYLLANPDRRGGQGHELNVTVLFADLKSFTKTVEHLPPKRALEVLNRYLAILAETITKHGGLVDKYLGDGLMAQWGAPMPWPDHAEAAVSACLEIQERLRTLTDQLQGTNEVTFEARLTLHSGPVVAGDVGAEKLEYTLIGDTVNVTSRMQETAKQLNADFLISETTHAALHTPLVAGQQAEVAIRGRTRPLIVFEVLGRVISSTGENAPHINGREKPETPVILPTVESSTASSIQSRLERRSSSLGESGEVR